MLHRALNLARQLRLVVAVVHDRETIGHLPAVGEHIQLQDAGAAAHLGHSSCERHIVPVPGFPMVHADRLAANGLVEARDITVQIQLIQAMLYQQLGRRVLEDAVCDARVAKDIVDGDTLG